MDAPSNQSLQAYTAATATTGAAAYAIGGTTLQSFAGISNDDMTEEQYLAVARRKTETWRRCQVISMFFIKTCFLSFLVNCDNYNLRICDCHEETYLFLEINSSNQSAPNSIDRLWWLMRFRCWMVRFLIGSNGWLEPFETTNGRLEAFNWWSAATSCRYSRLTVGLLNKKENQHQYN